MASGIPATCRVQWNALLSCYDSALASATTCPADDGGVLATCVTTFDAVSRCAVPDAGVTDAGVDAGLPLPTPSEWRDLSAGGSSVSFIVTGGGLSTPNAATGTIGFGEAPIGAPANSHIMLYGWQSLLGGDASSCQFGLVYNSAAGTYAFSNSSLLNAPCEVTFSGTTTTTLTVNGASVSRAPAGNLTLDVNVNGTGTSFMGPGTIRIIYGP